MSTKNKVILHKDIIIVLRKFNVSIILSNINIIYQVIPSGCHNVACNYGFPVNPESHSASVVMFLSSPLLLPLLPCLSLFPVILLSFKSSSQLLCGMPFNFGLSVSSLLDSSQVHLTGILPRQCVFFNASQGEVLLSY